MKIDFDKEADALYIYFRKGKIAKTIKAKDGLFVDVDKNNNILGLELLDVSRHIPNQKERTQITIGEKLFRFPVLAK